jgi:hypothetical protein
MGQGIEMRARDIIPTKGMESTGIIVTKPGGLDILSLVTCQPATPTG